MIDINLIYPLQNKYVDGQLSDGRLVEFKIRIPSNIKVIMPLIVAMANSTGGLIIFGVDDKKTIVGLPEDYQHDILRIESAINKLSVGIEYQLTNKIINEKRIVILEIMKSKSTSYFSRIDTTPARQIAYKFREGEDELYGYYKCSRNALYKGL